MKFFQELFLMRTLPFAHIVKIREQLKYGTIIYSAPLPSDDFGIKFSTRVQSAGEYSASNVFYWITNDERRMLIRKIDYLLAGKDEG
jgi:hypothetical protein